MSQFLNGGAVVGGGSRQGIMTDNYQRGAEVFPDLVRPARTPPPSMRVFRRQSINGVTRDGTGAALGAATVHAYRTVDDVEVDEVVSDADGLYDVSVYTDQQHYLVGYKTGAPDRTGATLNTIVGV